MVPHTEPFSQVRERIIIPRNVVNGLLTTLHIKLDHPSQFQLKSVVTRYFYALDLDQALQQTIKGFDSCVSLSQLPKATALPTTSDPPESIGLNFAADVICIYKQKILVLRESVTLFQGGHRSSKLLKSPVVTKTRNEWVTRVTTG